MARAFLKTDPTTKEILGFETGPIIKEILGFKIEPWTEFRTKGGVSWAPTGVSGFHATDGRGHFVQLGVEFSKRVAEFRVLRWWFKHLTVG
jgi:hypothetical protein